MKIYEIMEYRNTDEHYSWGVYSTEENARLYLKYMRWDHNADFEIIEREGYEKLRDVVHEKRC